MSCEDVRALLGEPEQVENDADDRSVTWSYIMLELEADFEPVPQLSLVSITILGRHPKYREIGVGDRLKSLDSTALGALPTWINRNGRIKEYELADDITVFVTGSAISSICLACSWSSDERPLFPEEVSRDT